MNNIESVFGRMGQVTLTWLLTVVLSVLLSSPSEAQMAPTPSGAGASASSKDPSGVVGRPFPVSESVRNQCKKRQHHDPQMEDDCPTVNKLLEKMAREPRDPAWAPVAEEKKRTDMLAIAPDTIKIRAIECRTTICAVEIESIEGRYQKALYRDRELGFGWGPSTAIDMAGFETNSEGVRVTVVVHLFFRK